MILLLACAPKGPPPHEDVFTFAVLGDRTDEPYDRAWQDVIAQVQARNPDLVLTVGDLADDALDPSDWDTALAATRVLIAPVEYTPGNHDIVDDATAAYFAERTGQAPYRSFDRGGVHFVVVDNSIAESWEALPEAQRAWLEADLAAHVGQSIVVLMHKPFWALRVAAGKPDPMHDLFVQSGVRLVLTGHWHTHLYERIDGIEYVGVGTSGGAWGGLQHPRRGNAFEYVWAEVRGGELALGAVAGGEQLPIDYVTLADNQRLRALRMGAVSALARDGRIELRLTNPGDEPVTGTLTVDPGTWTVPVREVAVDVAPGATFTATVEATPGEPLFPSPRIQLDWPLPDAGLVPYEAPVDVPREVRVPRGSAVVDGRLDEWAGAPDVGPLTTSAGLAAATEPTTVQLRHDGEAFYVAARMSDSEPGALARLHTGRDGHVVYDDRIGLLLSSSPDELVWFYVTPNGAVWDLRRSGGKVDLGWDAVEAAALVDEAGWTVEARIPFAAMGVEGAPGRWAFDVRRRQERTQTEATFTPAFGSRDRERIGVLRFE